MQRRFAQESIEIPNRGHETRMKTKKPVVSIAFAAALVFAMSRPATADEPAASWSPEKLQAAAAGCRRGILTRAFADYRKRQNLSAPTAEETAAMLDKVAQQGPTALEPFLATCECVTARIANQWDFDYVVAHPSETRALTEQLLSTDCAPPGTTPQPPRPE